MIAAPVGRGFVWRLSATSGLVLLVAFGGAALLGLSLVPASALADRLLGAAGETRAGPYTQELYAHVSDRLRLAGLLLLTGSVALAPLQVTVQRMFAQAVADTHRRLAFRRPWLAVPGPVVEVGLLVGVALVVRLAFLGQPMRYDEALSYNEFASRPLYYGLSFYPEPNNHLLNTLLVHATAGVLGNQPWMLRLPALVAGVLLVPATYGLGWLLQGRAAGLLAAALVAASSYLTEYSTNARGYTLQALAFVVAWCLTIWAARRGSDTALLLAALGAALGFWAVPTMLYGVAVIGAWLVAEAWAGRVRLAWSEVLAAAVLLGLLTCVLYLPVVVVSGPERIVANRFVEPLGGPDLAGDLATSLRRTWELWNRDLPWPVAAALGLGVALDAARALGQRRVPLAGLAGGVCLLLVLVQRVAPFERVWLFLLPVYLVLASGGLLGGLEMFAPSATFLRTTAPLGPAAGLPRWVSGLAALGVACLLGSAVLRSGSVLASQETGAFPDAAGVAEVLRGRLGPNDAVVTTLPASLPELQFYFRRDGLPIEALVRPPEAAQRVFVVATTDPPLAGWASPVVEARFPSASLYRLDRPPG